MMGNMQQDKANQEDMNIDTSVEPKDNSDGTDETVEAEETDTNINEMNDTSSAVDNSKIDTVESLKEQLELLQKSATDNLDKAIRAQAELDNVRKRTNRDIENAHKYALEKFVNELLPVLDSMELGINALENTEDIQGLCEGTELTIKMFYTSLGKFGVEPINPSEGDKFNPEQHEAVSTQENDAIESGTVISTLQKGYQLNGRLIRAAMVIVAK